MAIRYDCIRDSLSAPLFLPVLWEADSCNVGCREACDENAGKYAIEFCRTGAGTQITQAGALANPREGWAAQQAAVMRGVCGGRSSHLGQAEGLIQRWLGEKERWSGERVLFHSSTEQEQCLQRH